jgi:hypothetical protein
VVGGYNFFHLNSSILQISDHQQSWSYEDGPWKWPGPPPLVAVKWLIGYSSGNEIHCHIVSKAQSFQGFLIYNLHFLVAGLII